MLTFTQAEYWFSSLLWFCIAVTIAASIITVAAFFIDQGKKRAARIGVIASGFLELFCCVVWLFLAGSHQGLALVILIPLLVPPFLLSVLSGILLALRR